MEAVAIRHWGSLRAYRQAIAAVHPKAHLAALNSLFEAPDAKGQQLVSVYSQLALVTGTAIVCEAWARRFKLHTSTTLPNRIVLPSGFLVSADAEMTYSSYLSQVTDRDGGTTHAPLDALNTLAMGDAFYIGYSEPFYGVSLEIDGTNKNGNAANIACHYHNGTAYQAFTKVTDGTKSTDKTLDHDGEIQWDLPTDWVKTTKNGVEAYWARLSASAQLSATVDIEEAAVLLSPVSVALLQSFTLTGEGKKVNHIQNYGDDVAVIVKSLTGGGSFVGDFSLGFS